jgi:hypothetical protein
VHGPGKGAGPRGCAASAVPPVTWLGGSSGFDPVPPIRLTRANKRPMNENNRNLLLAVLLAAAVLLGWEYFVAMPQMQTQAQRNRPLLASGEEAEADHAAPQGQGRRRPSEPRRRR